MASTLIAAQLSLTLPLVGLIWFVQVVHYPLLREGGSDSFVRAHRTHTVRTAWIVGPLMVGELVVSMLLVVYGDERILGLARIGLALVGVVWLSTFLVQVPLHERLSRGWDARAHSALVRSNWLRTGTWTVRGAIALLLATGWMSFAEPTGARPAAVPGFEGDASGQGMPPAPPLTERRPAAGGSGLSNLPKT